jgi:hypothetical protein
LARSRSGMPMSIVGAPPLPADILFFAMVFSF